METNANLQGLSNFFRLQYDAGAVQQSAGIDNTALSDEEVKALLQALSQYNAGLNAAGDDFGASAVSLPSIASQAEMGSLSTADLLLIIATERRKTTEALISMTMIGIAAQEKTIEAESLKTDTEIDEAKAAQEKAEKMADIMNIVKWAVLALSVIAAVATGGVAGAVMLGSMAVMMAFSEIPVDGEKSLMELSIEGLEKSMGDGPEASILMAGIIALLMIGLFIATRGASAGSMAQGASNTATTAASASGEAAVTIASTSAKTAAQVSTTTLKANAAQFSNAASRVAQYGTIAQAAGDGYAAYASYEAAVANANVIELQAMLEYLQLILQQDNEFIQAILDLGAQLDAGVAAVVGNEFQANENRTQQMFS